MAENLNLNLTGSKCRKLNPDNASDRMPKDECDRYPYGRVYSWDLMMNSEKSSNTDPSGVQGICPEGWHIPSKAEAEVLFAFAEGTRTPLKSKKEYKAYDVNDETSGYGWDENIANKGTDVFGFAALPGGTAGTGTTSASRFAEKHDSGGFWFATENPDNVSQAFQWTVGTNYSTTNFMTKNSSTAGGTLRSVRCVKDPD